MKGSTAYHCLTPDDNLALKNACKINKLVSEVRKRAQVFYLLYLYHLVQLKNTNPDYTK